jgi:perosamine synthetase
MTIKLSPPVINDEDRDSVSAALRETDIAYGPVVKAFEREVLEHFASEQAVATISGTAALHLALIVVGVRAGDAVLIPTLTFAAPAHAARYVGAEPFLFDVDPEYRQLDVPRLHEWLEAECDRRDDGTFHRRSGRRIGAVVPVDLLGHPCDTDSLREAVTPFGVPIVEDAAQAFGAKLRGRPLGGSADVVCVSFNVNKTITTGGGGMLLSRNPKLVEEASFLASQAKAPGKEYVHSKVGFNYRLPSAQAALGLSQLGRFAEIADRKVAIAARYREALAHLPGLRLPREAPWATELNWLFTVHVDEDEFGIDARGAMDALGEIGVETRPIFTPLHEAGVYAGQQAHGCGNAERLAPTGVTLPSSIALEDGEIDRVAEGLGQVRS